jgi:hypothetical protein
VTGSFRLLAALASIAAAAAACDSAGTIVLGDAASDARTFDVVTFDAPTPFEAAPPHDAGDGGPDARDASSTADEGAGDARGRDAEEAGDAESDGAGEAAASSDAEDGGDS